MLIISEMETKLKALNANHKTEDEVLNRVKNLQKQLLSASLLNKSNLEQKLKQKLKVAEAEMYSQNQGNKNIEMGYLYQYIKEHYE